MSDEFGLTTNHDKVFNLILQKIKEETGIDVEFKQCVVDNIYHTSMMWWSKYKDVNKIADEMFKQIFSLQAYNPEDIFYMKDVNFDMPTSYGFIINKEGEMFHLLRQFNHGLVLASLYPKYALTCGYIAPAMHSRNSFLTVYDYQDFEIQHCEPLNVIRFASGHFDRVSFEKESVNELQLKSLKTWLTNMSMLDDNVVTEVGDMSNRKVLVEIDKLIANRKLNPQYKSVKPVSTGLGE